MPRDGSDVYSQPFPDVSADTTIESAVYNGFVADIATDLNTPRPIVAGGTDATNAENARFNLSTGVATQIVTNYDSHLFYPGGFRSAASATNPPVSSHAFAGVCYINEPLAYPPTNANVVVQARDLDDAATPGAVWVREKKAGVWTAWTAELAGTGTALDGKVDITGDTMTGHLALPTGPAAANAVRKDYVDAAAAAAAADTATKIGGTFSANDNRLVRTDGIGTKTAQDSPVIVADMTGALSNATTAGGIPVQGTQTNDNAVTGFIGEHVEIELALVSRIAHAVSGTSYQILSLSLTAGDWDVSAHAKFQTGTVNPTRVWATVGVTSTPVPNTDAKGCVILDAAFGVGNPVTLTIGPVRFSLSATTTMFLSSGQTYGTAGTAGGYGHLWARRVR